MDIKNLPGSGSDFRVSSGAGNFSKKLSSATRYGDLRNLADNRKAILSAVKKYEGVIKIGKFDRLRQLSAYNQIKKMDHNLSKDDKAEIKKMFKHLGGKK
jgi:hypothetical protein